MCIGDTRLTTAEKILRALERQNRLTEELLVLHKRQEQPQQEPNKWDTVIQLLHALKEVRA